MSPTSPRKASLLTIAVTVVFTVFFLPLSYFVDGGEIFGGLIVIPISLIAWNWGYRRGIVAAAIGAVCAELIFAIDHFLIRHRTLTLYWLIGTLVGMFVIPFIATIVGKLSEALQMKAKAESALRESEQHFRDIFLNAPFGYFRTTPEGKAISASPTMARMLGYDSPEEAMEAVNARGVANVLYDDPLQRDLLTKNVLKSPHWQMHEVRLLRKDATAITANVFLRSYTPEGISTAVLEGFAEDVTQHRLAEANAASSHQHLEAVLNALPDLMFETDRQGRILSFRANNLDRLYLPPEQFLGRTVDEVLPVEAAKSITDALEAAAQRGKHVVATYPLVMKNRTAWFELSVAAVGDPSDPDCHFIALSRDVTDRKTLEQQLLQSQKMEAVGKLAGGVAHDFNNIVMIILGFCDLIEGHIADQKKVREDLGVIRDSASRAASLTAQLLAFSRKQILQPKVLDLFALIQRMEKMLARPLGEDIALTVVASDQPAPVKADDGQLQQVIMNLAVNARDAMPQGGRLTMKVENVTFAENDPHRPHEVIPAEYVCLSVHDTGTGMSQEIISHIFEPFFTTKGLGKGTGLGLSIVYGIVKQSEGYIYVESKEGQGTTFWIYLPKAADEIGETLVHDSEARQERGSETVLLVEDDEAVRRLIRRSLEGRGYVVLEAANGQEALRLCDEKHDQIHLLLTDVVMLGIGGRQVAEAFRTLNPDAPVILMTGYADRENLGDADESFTVVTKPIGMEELLAKVQRALESGRSADR
jgi:PAS domain S-box-containing protein